MISEWGIFSFYFGLFFLELNFDNGFYSAYSFSSSVSMNPFRYLCLANNIVGVISYIFFYII